MSETDPMNLNERRKYLHKMRIRYWLVQGKAARGGLLDEMESVTGLHRKSILRLIHGELARQPRRRQRGASYGTEVVDTVRLIAQSLDYPCAERLQPNLVWMAEQLERHGELTLTEAVRRSLGQVSLSTVRRMVPAELSQRERIAYREGRRDASNSVAARIPMRRIPNEEPQPGHFEVDLVHHCGISASGQYVYTLQLTDVTTGWCEPVATLGRSYRVLQDGLEHIQIRLPFPILELHPDNGSEFLNELMLQFWGERMAQSHLSRSRPYHKNDNRFVEENNSSLVRAYLGYQRFDTVAQTNWLNRLYERLWLYHNFFQPVMRLQEKIIDPTTARIKRIFSTPLPPFDRLCASGGLSPEREQELQHLRASTNPLALRREIHALLDRLGKLPSARDGQVEDVHLTLGQWKPAPFSLKKGGTASVTLSFERTMPLSNIIFWLDTALGHMSRP